MEYFMDLNFAFAALAVAVAGIVRGFSGFGAGMILVPVLSLLYGPVVAVVSVVIMELVPAVQLLPGVLHRCDWRSVVPMSVAAVITVPLGSYVLVVIDEHSMRMLISVLVLSGVGLLASGWRYRSADSNRSAPVVTGAVSGMLSGATGLGGLPVVMYYLSGTQRAEVTRASVVIFLFVSVMVSLAMFIYHGIITRDILIRCLSLAPLLLVSIWIGGRLFGRTSESLFRNLLLVMLTVVSVLMLVVT